MGMLLRQYHPQPEDAEASASPYAGLSDDEVAEAYATVIGGTARKREKRIAALEAHDAEVAGFEPVTDEDPEGEDDESNPEGEESAEESEKDPEGE